MVRLGSFWLLVFSQIAATLSIHEYEAEWTREQVPDMGTPQVPSERPERRLYVIHQCNSGCYFPAVGNKQAARLEGELRRSDCNLQSDVSTAGVTARVDSPR